MGRTLFDIAQYKLTGPIEPPLSSTSLVVSVGLVEVESGICVGVGGECLAGVAISLPMGPANRSGHPRLSPRGVQILCSLFSGGFQAEHLVSVIDI